MTTAPTRTRSPWTPKAAKFERIEAALRSFGCYASLGEIIRGLRESGHHAQPEATAMNIGEMVRAGRINRIGRGRRGDPYLYCLAATPQPTPAAPKPAPSRRKKLTIEQVNAAIQSTGSSTAAARSLGVSTATIYNYLREAKGLSAYPSQQQKHRREHWAPKQRPEPPRESTPPPAPPPPRPARPRPEYLPPPAGPEELTQLWQEYSAAPTESRRNALAEHYFSIVTATAAAVHSKMPSNIEIDDLISAGSIGLMTAIAAFDLNRGLQFKTYAIVRIRGSMLDWLREQDQVPRLIRHHNGRIFKATEALRCELGREPEIKEVAQKLSLSVAELEGLISENHVLNTISLSRKFYSPDSFRDVQEIDVIEDESAIRPARRLNDLEGLREVTRGLNKTQRLIVIGYYYLGETMWETAQQLGLSESRVSQLHSMILAQIRERFKGVQS